MTRRAKVRPSERDEAPAGQAAETQRVARDYGLTLAQAQALLLVVGNDKARLEAAAARLKDARAE